MPTWLPSASRRAAKTTAPPDKASPDRPTAASGACPNRLRQLRASRLVPAEPVTDMPSLHELAVTPVTHMSAFRPYFVSGRVARNHVSRLGPTPRRRPPVCRSVAHHNVFVAHHLEVFEVAGLHHHVLESREVGIRERRRVVDELRRRYLVGQLDILGVPQLYEPLPLRGDIARHRQPPFPSPR